MDFSEDAFNMFAHFMMGDLQGHLPTLAKCSAVFDPEQHDTGALPPYSPNLTLGNFFFPDEKSPQREMFANVEEVIQKMAEALKGIKTSEFKNCFEQWKKCLNSCIASNGQYIEGD